ncbi:MAG: helix-turn-helix domain-containing protein [Planctomycetes bacterium]|nr:helix-turn-helix domain-containing protein [Planctomycetota bacterium]
MKPANQTPNDDLPLTSRQFAARCGVTDETIRRWVRGKRITPHGRTPTGQMRFHPDQVAEVLAARAAPTERAQDIEAHITVARERARLRRGTA